MKFEVGDKVEVISKNGQSVRNLHSFKVGDVGKIKHIYANNDYLEVEVNGYEQTVFVDSIKKIEGEI